MCFRIPTQLQASLTSSKVGLKLPEMQLPCQPPFSCSPRTPFSLSPSSTVESVLYQSTTHHSTAAYMNTIMNICLAFYWNDILTNTIWHSGMGNKDAANPWRIWARLHRDPSLLFELSPKLSLRLLLLDFRSRFKQKERTSSLSGSRIHCSLCQHFLSLMTSVPPPRKVQCVWNVYEKPEGTDVAEERRAQRTPNRGQLIRNRSHTSYPSSSGYKHTSCQ